MLTIYPIGLFNFAPTKNLVKEAFSFAQARSLLKSAAWMGIGFDEIEELLKEYYHGNYNEVSWYEIRLRLQSFYNDCKI